MTELDHVHEVDPDAALDITGDELVDAWRGVKAEEEEQVAGGLQSLLRSRSRALLADLARPHKAAIAGASVLIALSTACQLAVPWLIQQGIDNGIPPLLKGGSGDIGPLVTIVVAVLAMTVIAALSFNAFLLLLGRVGQQVILDTRRRLEQVVELAELFHR